MINIPPLFSIIIATYNSGVTLERCIKSIVEQTNTDYEIIVIDGKSTDDTIDIVKNFSSYPIKWISEKDDGIYDAWNKGVRLAIGRWIIFIGSDDYFLEDALAQYKQFTESSHGSNFDFISSKMELISQDGVIIKRIGLPWSWRKCRLQNVIAHPGSLHNRSLFDKFGLFDTRYRICGDYEFLLRPGENMKVGFLDKITVRMSQGGISFNAKKLFKEHYLVAISTGKLNKWIARFFYVWQMLKHYIKASIRVFKIDI